MKHYFRFFCLIVIFQLTYVNLAAQASYKLFVRPAKPLANADVIYVAGNFNNWDPAKTPLSYNAADSSWNISLPYSPDAYEFKFTRGSWDKVEANANGSDKENRVVKPGSDSIIQVNIAAWKDAFTPRQRIHTASTNVTIVDTAFAIPQLARNRRIWVYLPPDYQQSKKSYPVIYMHDGQNLFDELTSGFGEWGIDEFLDSLNKAGKNACIIVGIDNGRQRLNEYNPYDNQRFGKGEGAAYTDFIVKSLKPFIDRRFRTLKDKDNTAIAGSSMGGLISYYAALKNPEVFGKAGIFSPSFWIAPEMYLLTDSVAQNIRGKFFFYIGEQEGEENVQKMQEMMEKLGAKSSALIYSVNDAAGSHNEKAWRKWFPEFYKWIMADWTNYIIREQR
ncbi:MAG: hypothetical protein JWQ27_2860 [Ferruginibacter sp.]|nr:hypothetical protein [Ferruginibacter sp.]